MKLLYIVPSINNQGGVARVLSVRTNYFVENFGYEVTILTINQIDKSTFFDFNKKIKRDSLQLTGNRFKRLFQYKNQIESFIKITKPDVVAICDFSLRAFSLAILLKTKVPIIFEAHGSKYNESCEYKVNFISKQTHQFKYWYRNYCAKKFDTFIALSNESLKEWNHKNGFVIPNPINYDQDVVSDLTSKKVIVVSRQSYEKGIDRLLLIWKFINKKHPDWQLDIYGSIDSELGLKKLLLEYNITSSVTFYESVKNINEKYLDASLCFMTSRSEGFPMVLLEAMSFGLPVVAYDCPIGPRAIISNNYNGFLIEDGNEKSFFRKASELIENRESRNLIGKNAQKSLDNYKIENIMNQWQKILKSII